jgi:hypothetical protein
MNGLLVLPSASFPGTARRPGPAGRPGRAVAGRAAGRAGTCRCRCRPLPDGPGPGCPGTPPTVRRTAPRCVRTRCDVAPAELAEPGWRRARRQLAHDGAQLRRPARRPRAAGAPGPAPLLLAACSAGQDPRVLRQADQQVLPADAWRFTVHAGSAQAQHLRVCARIRIGSTAAPPPPRAALRLELVLADGTMSRCRPNRCRWRARSRCARRMPQPGAPARAAAGARRGGGTRGIARAGLEVSATGLPAGPRARRLPAEDAAAA